MEYDARTIEVLHTSGTLIMAKAPLLRAGALAVGSSQCTGSLNKGRNSTLVSLTKPLKTQVTSMVVSPPPEGVSARPYSAPSVGGRSNSSDLDRDLIITAAQAVRPKRTSPPHTNRQAAPQLST